MPLPTSTSLFSRTADVAALRARLAPIPYVSVDAMSDDELWANLVAAEAEASRALRVLFEPTVVIPEDAPQSEIDALVASNTKFMQESPYDYDPSDWTMDVWGFILLRQKPVISVDSMKFTYPTPASDVLIVPSNWIRLDKKYGHLRVVPTGTLMGMGPLSSYLLQAMSSGRIIPNMVHIRYTAGLSNVAEDWPDLVSLVKRMASMKILKQAFVPQSGSISADGLSQSSSLDLEKMQDAIDKDLNDLRDSIHGVRLGVF